MNDDEKRRIEQVALFRFGVLGDLVHLTPGHKGIAKQLAEKAARDYLIPDELADAIRYVAFGHQHRHWVAALLARIPDAGAWRAHLRRQVSNDDPRQMLLL